MPRLKPDAPMWPPDTGLLHIIAQYTYHGDAYIAGNKLGLTRLRDALTAAIEAPSTTQEASAYCTDGEGYRVRVRCETEGAMELVPLGYTDEKQSSKYAWPHWMHEHT